MLFQFQSVSRCAAEAVAVGWALVELVELCASRTVRAVLFQPVGECAVETSPSLTAPVSAPLFLLAEAAKAFHESLYRQKLASLLEKKQLSEADDGELRKMQVRAVCI